MTPAGSWFELLCQAQAEHAELPEAGYAQLASVRPDGTPACRTVRPRAVQPQGRLVLTTDLRSAKVQEFGLRPAAELCWYFPHSRLQFRLAGQVHVLGEEATATAADLRERAWLALSPQARQRFTWPAPGRPLAASVAFSQGPPAAPPAGFGVLVLEVTQVDLLDLRPEPHLRFQAAAHEQWLWRAVNP